MFERAFKVKVPANATTVDLPLGVDATALLEVTDRDDPTRQVRVRRAADGTVTIDAATFERNLQVSVTQLNPLAPTHGAVPDWSFRTEYFKGELMYWRGHTYRANEDLKRGHSYWNTAYPHWSQWTKIHGHPSELVFMTQVNNESSGFWPCDGTVINAPWSMLHGKTAPNMLGQIVASAGTLKDANGNTVRTIAQGQNNAQNTAISYTNLPTGQFGVVVAPSSAGTPSGTVNLGYSGEHQHTLASCGSGTSSSYFDHNASGSSYDAQYYSESVRPGGNHTHPVSFAGSPMSAHSHQGSYAVLNNSGAQQPLAYYPACFGIVPHVRL